VRCLPAQRGRTCSFRRIASARHRLTPPSIVSIVDRFNWGKAVFREVLTAVNVETEISRSKEPRNL